MKKYDNYNIEQHLYDEGYNYICGTDEVGRGPLCGPVCSAAVIMPKGLKIDGVTDSKKVSEKNRIILDQIIKEKALSYAIVFIDEKKIDEINIYEASRLAMYEAIKKLEVKPDIVLADAMPLSLDIPCESIIKGDAKSFTIACASILAKVARDNLMDEYDKLYPMYGFKNNKGYPTKAHLQALKEYGVLPIHRLSYKPVSDVASTNHYYKEQ